ncbi:MAG: glycerol kinase GlpK, partial [Clostridia bacterium]|nr:glycerol kinase GlpK [Clostridia bacterium]
IGIDEGTTSARAVLFDTEKNEIIKQSQSSFKQYFPKDGWVEHDAEEIWNIVQKALIEITKGIASEEIFSIGITNQRESVVAFSKKSGKALAPSICWQCRRTAPFCKKLKESSFSSVIKEKTGLIIDSYFSASKIRWLLRNNEAVKKALKEDDLFIGTIDAFLVYKLTKGKVFATDVTNASRTQLMNIKTLEWDNELLSIFDVPKNILPTIKESAEDFGIAEIDYLRVPIYAILGDQQSSLFGQGCTSSSEMKSTYGTGAFLLENLGNKIVYSNDLLTTVAYKINGRVCYALEGSIYNCGTAIDWATGTLNIAPTPHDMDLMAGSLGSNNGVYMVPAFTGLGCPYWNMDSSGIITGLTRATTKEHLARAVLESIAYSVYDVIKVFEKEGGKKIKELSVDGGATKNEFLMQFQSDLLNAKINVKNKESTSLGVIYLSGMHAGAYSSLEEIKEKIISKKTFEPKGSTLLMKQNLEGWKNAIEKCRNFN